MKTFGGPAILLDRNDINTDEIIPAKHLNEITKMALKPHILEDLKIGGFNPRSEEMERASVIISRANFGCGSSREHAVWVFEVNDINMVIAESFARIFRQNMFNCGMIAAEISKEKIDALFNMGPDVEISVDLETNLLQAKAGKKEETFPLTLNTFDQELVLAGGWLAYADKKY